MSNYALGAQATTRPASRIDTDIETIKRMTSRVDNHTDRILRHAHTLGYFAPPAEALSSANGQISPVTSNLADAIRELDRAMDRLDGALNLFD